MTTQYSPGTLWLVFLAAGVGTYLLRVSFIVLLGRLDEVPARVKLVLRFIPGAVLATLVVPALVYVDGSLALDIGNEKLLAGALAAVVAWRTENVLATIAVGMVALWGFEMVF